MTLFPLSPNAPNTSADDWVAELPAMMLFDAVIDPDVEFSQTPPPIPAVLAETVERFSAKVPAATSIPPPNPPVLRAMVELLIVAVPSLTIIAVALFPDTVQVLRVSVPLLKMPPPPPLGELFP